MGKPRLIILIRHAQSEGNKNREIHQTIPDHRVKLTQDGWGQALDAGRRLRKLLRADDKLHIFTSPYRRTRETTEGILATLTSDEEEEGGPSPFKRNNIKVYEEPRLREQDFGNFQPCSAEMERMWQERADYGHFFYRIPDGESAADAYDRVSGFNESLWRQFGEDDFASVCILVTHGLMSRVFLMKWYHWGVEYFEDLRNVNHCEFLIMRKQEDSGKYILENKLRTWSELRRERAQKQKEEESGQSSGKDAAKLEKALVTSQSTVSLVPQRRWGGCPNGCNHDKNFKIRSDHSDLIKRDGTNVYDDDNKTAKSSSSHPAHTSAQNHASSLGVRRPAARRFHSAGNNQNEPGDENTPQIDITRAREEVVSSPDGTPSFISVEERIRAQSTSPSTGPRRFLHLGRDFGGTYSGHTSDADSSEDERMRGRLARLKMSQGGSPHSSSASSAAPDAIGSLRGGEKIETTNLSITVSAATPTSENASTIGTTSSSSAPSHKRDPSGMGRRVRANRLGDAPHCSDCEQHGSSDGPDHGEGDDEDEEEDDGLNVATPEGEIDELDEELDRAEAKDRSLRESVY